MPDAKPSHTPIIAASPDAIAQAVALLRAGEAVGLPTETVYGLAADATQAQAVASIYRIKGRPDFNPLIVHVPDIDAAGKLAMIDGRARQLAEKFWPGPLTMVLPVRDDSPVTKAVTAGLATIAVRAPRHPLMRAVLNASGLFLAAPSANRSGGISPTRAIHVAQSLGEKLKLIVDGGACEAGLESTIVALRDTGWQILREGPVSAAAIAGCLGGEPMPVQTSAIEAPGQLASHYAPSKSVKLDTMVAKSKAFHIGFGSVSGDLNLSASGDLTEAAAALYDALHQADASDRQSIAIAPIPHSGIGIAINDRLRRAAV